MNDEHAVKGRFYEFFAGGGMARAGLGPSWQCLFANDNDSKKEAAYTANWGNEEFKPGDVKSLTTSDLPGFADLAWASFPCQDLSLAGSGAGLEGARSGTFWPFWGLMKGLKTEGRSPTVIALENVCGALTSHDGRDFAALVGALQTEGYRLGALVMDAVRFVPQSRPRLFIVAAQASAALPMQVVREKPDPQWTPAALEKAYENLDEVQQSRWIWWNVPEPARRTKVFSDLIEEEPEGVCWHTPAETKRLLDLMSPLHREKVELARGSGQRKIGTIYKRMREDANGQRTQRAEVRFDDIAGCLRTPVGGSSRQTILVVEGQRLRSRLLSPREAGRLMGLEETYKLPPKYNEAYHLAGDGLVVPVVRHLAAHLLEPIVEATRLERRQAA